MVIFLAIAIVIIGVLGCLYYELTFINAPKISLNVKATEYDDEAVYVVGEITNTGNKTAYIKNIRNHLNRKIFIYNELAFVDKLNLLEESEFELTPASKRQILLGSIQTISTLNPEDYSDNSKYSDDKISFDISYSSKSNSKEAKAEGKHEKKPKGKNKKVKGNEVILEVTESKNNMNERGSDKDRHTTFDFNLHHDLFNEAEKIILNRTIINEKYYRARRHSNNFINTLSFPTGEATRKLYKRMDVNGGGAHRLTDKEL